MSAPGATGPLGRQLALQDRLLGEELGARAAALDVLQAAQGAGGDLVLGPLHQLQALAVEGVALRHVLRGHEDCLVLSLGGGCFRPAPGDDLDNAQGSHAPRKRVPAPAELSTWLALFALNARCLAAGRGGKPPARGTIVAAVKAARLLTNIGDGSLGT